MRVGLMAPPWVPVPPPRYGGTEAVIDRLARGLVAAGHEVFLWTTGDSTCPVPRGHVLDVADGEHMGLAAVELRHLIHGYRAMIDRGVDIVHDHTLIGPVYARRHPELPVVTTNHGPFDQALTDLYRAVAGEVPVIAISRDQASRAGDVPIEAVIHHGLDLDRFPVGDGGGDAEGPYLAFLGRMAPEKGARRAALVARKAGMRLLMAAKMREPWEKRFFAEQVEPLLGDGIEYIGEIGHEDKVRLLGGARALVNPIRWPEPFGLVMIEALACGTPVLAFHQGSAPELVDHGVTGYLSDSVDAMADDVARLDALDRAACRRAAEARFSTERMVREHLAVYEQVIRRHRS
ncbi:MAG: glycosyltransferase family 4 protein [Actinomyces sp.]|nr:MAG: glycosyltransferase family 4 protein [Actinomyces sp.]